MTTDRATMTTDRATMTTDRATMIDSIGAALANSAIDASARIMLSFVCRSWRRRMTPTTSTLVLARLVDYVTMLAETGWGGGVRRLVVGLIFPIDMSSNEVTAMIGGVLARCPLRYAATVAAMLIGYHPSHDLSMAVIRDLMRQPSCPCVPWASTRSVPAEPWLYRRYLSSIAASTRSVKSELLREACWIGGGPARSVDAMCMEMRPTLLQHGWTPFPAALIWPESVNVPIPMLALCAGWAMATEIDVARRTDAARYAGTTMYLAMMATQRELHTALVLDGFIRPADDTSGDPDLMYPMPSDNGRRRSHVLPDTTEEAQRDPAVRLGHGWTGRVTVRVDRATE